MANDRIYPKVLLALDREIALIRGEILPIWLASEKTFDKCVEDHRLNTRLKYLEDQRMRSDWWNYPYAYGPWGR